MPEITLTINNKVGLHARPASVFVKEAARFSSSINVVYGGRDVNAKSILNVLTLGINQGAEIKVVAEGEDSAQALEAIKALVTGNFGETE